MQVSNCREPLRKSQRTDIGAAALENEGTIVPEDPIQILRSPQPRGAHRLDQVRAGKQRNVDALLFSSLCLDSAHDVVQLVAEVIQNLHGRQILLVQRLPRIDTNPGRAVSYSDPGHVYPVVCGGKSSLLICVTNRAEEAADDFVLSLELAVVGSLLEHAEMQIRRWGEGAARHEHERRFGGIGEGLPQAVAGEFVRVERHGVCGVEADVEDGLRSAGVGHG